jgi:hypothetical protein
VSKNSNDAGDAGMLSASGGLESSNLPSWLAMPSRFWAIGPALIGTIFDGGRRKQQLMKARASCAAAVADYRQIALTAFQEVEDNLAADQTLAADERTQDLAVRSSQHALGVAPNRYQAGAVSYLDVTLAQSTALTNECAAAQIARRRSHYGELDRHHTDLFEAAAVGRASRKACRLPRRRRPKSSWLEPMNRDTTICTED